MLHKLYDWDGGLAFVAVVGKRGAWIAGLAVTVSLFVCRLLPCRFSR
jgi:hypothetical protein